MRLYMIKKMKEQTNYSLPVSALPHLYSLQVTTPWTLPSHGLTQEC